MADKGGSPKSGFFNDADDDFFEDSFFNNLDNAISKETCNTACTTTTRSDPVCNINNRLDNNVSKVCALSCDEEINGFDKIMGETWIYPTNYPVRDYQFNIIKAAILNNTLVSLPTGLGKTFIAAVIMYNFYRWYPVGKIIFTAPTRPLVAQQVEACYNICAIPSSDTVEMTGHMQVNTRKLHWQNKRVFFATPQVIYNDIKSGICPCEKIRCIVFDEAHKARGNYAYCQIVSTMTDMKCRTYRVVALSATPGSKVDDVINVVKNLHIAHLELRTENCIDVARYNHFRRINTVIVPLGTELDNLRARYLQILDVYARKLKQFNILPTHIGNLSKGRVVMLYKEYQAKDRGSRHPQHNYIMKDFVLLISLLHGLELLTKHGSRVFLNFFDEHPEKPWMQSDDQLTGLLEMLRLDLGLNPMSLDTSILPDGTIPEIPNDLRFGHPKFDKLKEIMLEHFQRAKDRGQDTRAIVFCEYRESVNLVDCLLLQCRPLIMPQTFVGQGASGKDGKTIISQKQQLRVMHSFRAGSCNTLVATCVAEEGLDVGSVDLIVCFDISTRSPIRLVQRCGRTGRERGGQVHILVTEGREHQTLLDCMRQRDGLANKVLQSKEIDTNLYKLNPRMLPRGHIPQCQKMYITVNKKPEEEKQVPNKTKKNHKDIRAMLSNKKRTVDLTKTQFDSPEECHGNGEASVKSKRQKERKSLELERKLESPVNTHSSDAKICEVNNSSEQPVCTSSPSNLNFNPKSPVKQKETKKKKMITTSPGKRDGDIRALFSTAIKSTKNYTKVLKDLGLQNEKSTPTAVIDLLVELSIVNSTNNTREIDNKGLGNTKEHNIENGKLRPNFSASFLTNPYFPDINLIDRMDSKAINDFLINNKINTQEIGNGGLRAIEQWKSKESNNMSAYDTKISPIKNIKTQNSTDNNFDIGDIEDIFDATFLEEAVTEEEDKIETVKIRKSGDIRDIENIIDLTSTEETVMEKEVEAVKEKPKEALDYFGLVSIDDIFADDNSDDSMQSIQFDCETKTLNSEENNNRVDVGPPSPSLLTGVFNDTRVLSPIISTQMIKPSNNSTPTAKQLFPMLQDTYIEQSKTGHDANNSKSMFTVTQIVEMINDTSAKSKSHNTTDVEGINSLARAGSISPILMTQADKRNSLNISDINTTKDSIIILESDSDDTNDYNVDEEINKVTDSPKLSQSVGSKREEPEDIVSASPYFNKKFKQNRYHDEERHKLQNKIKNALSLNKHKNNTNNDRIVNYVFTSPLKSPLKENNSPIKTKTRMEDNIEKPGLKLSLSNLQKFRKENKLHVNVENDDFVNKNITKRTTTDSKKKKKENNEFLDLEAVLVCSSGYKSGDELSDDSEGSIKDFICDDDKLTQEDIQAQYLQSIKHNTVKGTFKIPVLPKITEDIFSQKVIEEDTSYQIDSFCVDSHLQLTQDNDMSELELAEMKLKEMRRKKKRKKRNLVLEDSQGVSDEVLERWKRRRLSDIDSD